MKKQMSNSIAFVKGVEVGIHEVENLYASIQKQRRMEGMIAAKKTRRPFRASSETTTEGIRAVQGRMARWQALIKKKQRK
ncbi:MAG: hypothetical protein ACLTD8_14000 [Acutalibacteraceae bacterium]